MKARKLDFKVPRSPYTTLVEEGRQFASPKEFSKFIRNRLKKQQEKKELDNER